MEGKTTSIKAQNTWNKLTGDPSEFTMENRAFNSVSAITTLMLILALPVNFIIDLPEANIITLVALFIQFYFYYRARFKKKYKTGLIVYASLSYIILALTFCFNSGSEGPTLLYFIITFLLLFSITRGKYFGLWLCLHIFSGIFLIACEYYKVPWIHFTYTNNNNRLIDIVSSYVVTIIFVFFITNYLRKSYENEKKLAEERSKDIGKQNQQIRIQNEQLEKLNEEKDKLFSIISHDLRSPLNSMQGYLEILTEDDIEEDERDMMKRELLDLTKNTSDMLQNLLSWSKTQMQGVKVQIKPMALENTISQALEFQKSIAAKKGIQISIQNNEPIEVLADNDMLELVIRNLVNNAIKFTNPGGIITVSAKKKGQRAEISIKDNGIGISAEQQKEIFTLKSKSTYGTTNEKGMGLGLLLCKEFIELQNGRISFSSIPGSGSEFIIALPLS